MHTGRFDAPVLAKTSKYQPRLHVRFFLLAQVMRFFEKLSRRQSTVVATRVTNSGDKML